MAEEKTGIVQGFKEFVMRGNVLDLAVAVVVGAAFTAVIKAFTRLHHRAGARCGGRGGHRGLRLLPAVGRRPLHE